MQDAAFFVLRDLEHIMLLALVLGLAAYGMLGPWLRQREARRPGAMPMPATGDAAAALAPPGSSRARRFGAADLVVVGLLLAFYYTPYALEAPSASSERGGSDAEITLVSVGVSLMLNLAQLTMILVVIAWVSGNNPVELFGLARTRGGWVLAVTIVVATAVFTPIILWLGNVINEVWIEPIFGRLGEQGALITLRTSESMALKLGVAFAAILVAPVVEEVVFRGYIFGVLREYTSTGFSLILTSAFFALAHPNLAAVFPLFLFAVVLNSIYVGTKSLWVPIGVHACFNAVNVINVLIQGEPPTLLDGGP